MRQLRVRVITPQTTVLDEAAEQVVAPLADGWIGIMPGHAPFQARVLPGQVVLQQGGRRRILATIGGALAVDGATVTILTGAAAPEADLARLEQNLGTEAEQHKGLEREAEAHFDRLYRAMADTLNQHGRRRG